MRHRARSIRALCVLAPALLVAPRAAVALTDEEIFRDFRFNLINPGARSLALGGAFISLADDATAAQANPAGLSFLLTQEYFVELRYADNAAQSAILTETLPAGIDTFVATGTDLEDETSSTFLSAVVPYGRWTLGLSRQEVINNKNGTLNSFAFTFPGSSGAFLAEGSGFIDVNVESYNISVGGRITDRLGIGATLTSSRIDVRSSVTNIVVDIGGNVVGCPSNCTEVLEPTLDLRTSIDDDDWDVVASLGIIYKATDRWSFGAVYRRGPNFPLVQQIDPTQGQDTFNVRGRLGTLFRNDINLPDSYGVGVNWRHPNDRLILALDAERIRYSNLLEGYVAGVNVLTGPDAVFTVDDATDFRLGAEYIVFTRFSPLGIRGGLFTESDSTIRAVSTGTNSLATREAFAGRDDELHGALGLGFNLKERLKLDLGADFSETDNEYLISIIFQGKPAASRP